MSPFENIVDAIHGLSLEEKSKLRTLLDEELKAQPANVEHRGDRGRKIIGLFADEPELMDRVMETVYERRMQPRRHP